MVVGIRPPVRVAYLQARFYLMLFPRQHLHKQPDKGTKLRTMRFTFTPLSRTVHVCARGRSCLGHPSRLVAISSAFAALPRAYVVLNPFWSPGWVDARGYPRMLGLSSASADTCPAFAWLRCSRRWRACSATTRTGWRGWTCCRLLCGTSNET